MPPTKPSPAAAESPHLRIGAVSRITGIPVDTLRAWERRYAVVAPRRAGGSARLYDEQDVERLQRIKRLVDAGHAIGSIAGLPREELDALLSMHSPDAPRERSPERVLVYSEFADSALDEDAAVRDGLTLLARHRTWAAFEAAALESDADALVLELGALMPERTRDVLSLARRLSAARVVVTFAFGPSALVARLDDAGVVALRAPIAHGQLVREIGRAPTPLSNVDLGSLPELPPAFSDAALARLARVSTTVQCECPHHLVEIVRTLSHFEQYSAECENRDTSDAELHERLRRTAATARVLFERALFEVAEHEGIELPPGVRRELLVDAADGE